MKEMAAILSNPNFLPDHENEQNDLVLCVALDIVYDVYCNVTYFPFRIGKMCCDLAESVKSRKSGALIVRHIQKNE